MFMNDSNAPALSVASAPSVSSTPISSRTIPSATSPFTTVLWDLDGTIIDSRAGIFNSFNHTFNEMGLPPLAREDLNPYIGPPLLDSFIKICGGNLAEAERAKAIYRERYIQGGGALEADVFPGILEVIEASKASGKFNSLATSKGFSGVKIVGEHFDFLHLFDVLGTATNDGTRSTKADVVAYALAELELLDADVSRVVLVGDRIHDIEGAREHGIEVILVKWGSGDESEWAQADAVAETPADLAALLGLS
jgi:phosphoglycolate phosphatase